MVYNLYDVIFQVQSNQRFKINIMSDLNNVDQFETEETETEIDEVQAFLTEWSQKRRSSHKRKSAGRSENRDQLDKFAGFNYPQFARQQHIGNLVTCMRLFTAARLDKQAAACMSTLLHAEVRAIKAV